MGFSKPIAVKPSMRILERSPDDPDVTDASKSVYSVRMGDFIPPLPKGVKRRRGEFAPYVIVGFDTEFKGPDGPIGRAAIREGKAKYRVLSYQFHCRTEDGTEWSGVGCPDNDERISIGEFLVYALGKGIAEEHVKRMPTTIYLVGHFTRADFPAFSDFKSLQSVISAVRNTFVSIDEHIPIDLTFRAGKKVQLRVILRDTMLLTPGGSKSLASLGDLVGRPKIVLADDRAAELYIKRNMDVLRREKWNIFREYALNDAVICTEYLARIVQRSRSATGLRKIPVTLTSIGVDLLLKSWKRDLDIEPIYILGKEEVYEERWEKRLGHFRTVKREVPRPECQIHVDFVTETYHGGRNEQFWFGPSYEADWTDFDLSSAYPTAMALIGLADWRAFRVTRDASEFKPTTLGFAWVDFKFPDTVRYPTLPVRTQNGLVFPQEGSSYCAAPEVFLALDLGASISVRHGVICPTDETIRIFGHFIKGCLEERKRYPKKSLDALFWKEVSNSTYGKTAQGLREKRVFDLRDRDMKPLPPSRVTNPFFASFITSFVRAVLGEIINSLPEDVMVFSCTTDGFLCDATEAQIIAAQGGTLATVFAESRRLLTGEPVVLEKKHAVRQLLGWRTRGQATLIPGPVNPSDSTYSVVLARGGISIEEDYDTVEQQSEHICRLFFDRTPDDTVRSTSLTGLRDIVEYDADLVEKELTRRLSMEFDWKRRPKAIGAHPGCHEHIVFSTQPWRTVEEFQSVRSLWNEFQKKRPTCIKTPTDFDAFANYAESYLLLSDENKRYLATSDGDLKRLRQSLCAAWKNARHMFGSSVPVKIDGMHTEINTSEKFAIALTHCGIDATKIDVDNGSKRKVTGGDCPPTERALAAFGKLQRFFPALRVGEFFDDAGHLGTPLSCSVNKCIFVERVAVR